MSDVLSEVNNLWEPDISELGVVPPLIPLRRQRAICGEFCWDSIYFDSLDKPKQIH